MLVHGTAEYIECAGKQSVGMRFRTFTYNKAEYIEKNSRPESARKENMRVVGKHGQMKKAEEEEEKKQESKGDKGRERERTKACQVSKKSNDVTYSNECVFVRTNGMQ